MIRILLEILAIICLGIIQVSFLTTWPAPVSSLNLIFTLVIFFTVIISYRRGLIWGLGGGLFLELYSGSIFGANVLALMLTVIYINFLFSNLFTNRSLYSLLIFGFIGTISYNLVITFYNLVGLGFGLNVSFVEFDFWRQFFWQPLFNVLILAIIFICYYLSTGRLRNIFLITSDFYETKGSR